MIFLLIATAIFTALIVSFIPCRMCSWYCDLIRQIDSNYRELIENMNKLLLSHECTIKNLEEEIEQLKKDYCERC